MGNPNVSELCVYDLTLAMVPAAGVAADLSHLNKKVKVSAYAFDKDDKAIDKAGECLTGCHLVLVPAGVPRKPGQDRKDLLNINAGIAKNIVEACAKFCPDAVVALIVNPVNSVVPAMTELWDKKVQDAGTVVVAAKNGKGSATLSMAYAGAQLGAAVLAGLNGEERTECAYVKSSVTELPYFASKVTFGKEGVKTVHSIGQLSSWEETRLKELLPTLKEEIDAGLEYAAANEFAS